MMKIVDIDYAANLPLYLIVEFCGHQHRIQLDVIEASKLKTFMRRSKQEFDRNPPASTSKTLFLGVIPVDGMSPIPYDEYLRRNADKDKKGT